MIVPQRIKKIANVAERQIGNVAGDAKKFVFGMGKRTMTTTSTESDSSSSSNSPTHEQKSTNSNNSSESSLFSNALVWTQVIPPVPVIPGAIYRHFAQGPSAKSWSLTTDLTVAVMRDFISRSSKMTVEDIQRLSTTKKFPIASNITRRKFTVPNEYREKAGDILKKQLTQKEEHAIGWDWEKGRENAPPLKGEWLQQKGNPLDPCKESTILYIHGGAYYMGCYGLYRQLLCKLIKSSKGRTCATNYRLAPQHPFPAAVEDVLATYLYLIDPPKEEGNQPIDPKKIVVSGDSAGGGLTFALLIAIRDSGLPAPAGAMTFSPWVDLTHSLPSIIKNIMTDYLPAIGFKHAPSPALDYARLPHKGKNTAVLEQAQAEANALEDSDGNLQVPETENPAAQRSSIGPFAECVPVPGAGENDIYRVQFYANNDALKIPMVSPVFDRNHLRGLPKLLVQYGSAERLGDESIYLALKASKKHPGASKKDDKYGPPTPTVLEEYIDQPHVFQMLFNNKSTSRAIKSMSAFFRDVTNSPCAAEFNDKDKHYSSYDTTDNLMVKSIDSQGKVTDIKDKLLSSFSKAQWADWEMRLARPSLKQRLDMVSAAYEEILLGEKHARNKQQ